MYHAASLSLAVYNCLLFLILILFFGKYTPQYSCAMDDQRLKKLIAELDWYRREYSQLRHVLVSIRDCIVLLGPLLVPCPESYDYRDKKRERTQSV